MRRRTGVGLLMGALAIAVSLTPILGLGQGSPPVARPSVPGATVIGQQGAGTAIESGKPVVILEYVAPTSFTWGPSPAAPPTFAFGKPAQVLLVVPGGYVVRQELPPEEAIVHAMYVSGQIGRPITVTIPDPAGGPARVEYVGTSRNDR